MGVENEQKQGGIFSNFFNSLSETVVSAYAGSKAFGSKVIEWCGEGALKVAKVAKRFPILGAVVTSGFVRHEVNGLRDKGLFREAEAALDVGIMEIGGNVLGFGVGDVCRELKRKEYVDQDDRFTSLDRSDLLVIADYGASRLGFNDPFNMRRTWDKPLIVKRSFSADMCAISEAECVTAFNETVKCNSEMHDVLSYSISEEDTCVDIDECNDLNTSDLFDMNKSLASSSSTQKQQSASLSTHIKKTT